MALIQLGSLVWLDPREVIGVTSDRAESAKILVSRRSEWVYSDWSPERVATTVNQYKR